MANPIDRCSCMDYVEFSVMGGFGVLQKRRMAEGVAEVKVEYY